METNKEYNWIRNTKTHMFIKPHFPYATREVINLNAAKPEFRDEVLKAGSVAELRFLDQEQPNYERIANDAVNKFKECLELLEKERAKSNKYYEVIKKLRDGIHALKGGSEKMACVYIDEATEILKS